MVSTDAHVADEIIEYRMYIDGSWTDAVGHASFPSMNPFSGTPWATIPAATHDDVDVAVRAARVAFESGAEPFPLGAIDRLEHAGVDGNEGETIGLDFEERASLLAYVQIVLTAQAGCFFDVAVDPSLGRVYALVIYERLEEEGPKGAIRLDPEWDTAGILYAFSTTIGTACNQKSRTFVQFRSQNRNRQLTVRPDFSSPCFSRPHFVRE